MPHAKQEDAPKHPRGGYLLGLIGVIIFGLTLPMTRIALVDFDPIFIAVGRAVVAAMAAVAVLALTRQRLPERRHLMPLLIVSGGVVIGFPLFATIAMQHVPAAHGGIVTGVLPLATAVAAVWFAKERPSALFWLAALSGSLVVVIFSVIEGGAIAFSGYADLLLILATICASIGYAQGGVLARELGGWQVICWALVIALPVLIATLLLFAGPVPCGAAVTSWLAFGYLAIGSQFLGFFAWNAGLARGGIANVGQLQLLQTFVTLAGAALLLGEAITPVQLMFAVLVVAIVLAGKRAHVAQAASSAPRYATPPQPHAPPPQKRCINH
ncbi:MAG: DMT family transporter [Pseudomonadota bacterium]